MEDDYNDTESKAMMDEAISSLTSVCDNLKGLVSDIVHPPDSVNFTTDINRINQGLKTLRSNIDYFVGPFIENKEKEMTSTIEEMELLKSKYEKLQRECDNQKENVRHIKDDLFKTRAQLNQQNYFCTSLGAIMGNLTWKVTRLPNIVELLLSTNQVSELLSIVSGSLEAFMETFSTGFPDVDTNETQFILSLLGTVTNIAGTAPGRQFLVTEPNGRQLVTQMLTILPYIPDDSGDIFKRVVLMCIYNISINRTGLMMLLESKSFLEELSKNILEDTKPELQLLALRLVQSLTLQIPSSQVYKDITQSIPVDFILKLTNKRNMDIQMLASSVVKSLQTEQEKFISEKNCGAMDWDE